jgi:hypothetical protein
MPPPEGRLAEDGAAFVTWKRDGRLRGCIGSVEAVRPLAEDVARNAVAALVHDPRFDVLFRGRIDFGLERKAYQELIASGGSLKPDLTARSQPPGAEPAPQPE